MKSQNQNILFISGSMINSPGNNVQFSGQSLFLESYMGRRGSPCIIIKLFFTIVHRMLMVRNKNNLSAWGLKISQIKQLCCQKLSVYEVRLE